MLDDALVVVAEDVTDRLMWFMPPQEGKSQRVSRWFPLWMLLRNPDLRIGIASYELGVARRWGRSIRNEIKAHPELGLKVRLDTSAAHEWELEGQVGGVFCTGVGGPLSGRPIDLMLIDAPVKGRAEADSEAYRQAAQDWWQETVSARLGERTPIVLVMTRWHEADLAGWLQVEHPGQWHVVNIPALADHDPAKGETDPLGREPGEWLISARGRTVTGGQRRRKDFGERGFTALCQGRPSPAEGDVLKRGWWQFYRKPLAKARPDGSMWCDDMDEVIQSWDCTFKDTKGADYVVGGVWGRKGPNAYLRDLVRDRLNFPATCRAIEATSAKWPQAHGKLVEDKANGPAVMDELRSRIGGMIPVVPMTSKLARANGVSPYIESGNVWLPDPSLAPRVAGFIEEGAGFPHAAHDDQVDMTTQALHRLMIHASAALNFLSQLTGVA